MTNSEKKLAFWSVPASEMLQELQTTAEGLKSSESDERLKKYGANILRPKKSSNALKIFFPSGVCQMEPDQGQQRDRQRGSAAAVITDTACT